MGKRPVPEIPADYTGPVRSCISCRRRLPQTALLRLCFTETNGIMLQLTGRRLPGRGAYLCPDPNCHVRAQRKGLLARALRHAVPFEVWERLAPELVRLANQLRESGDPPAISGQGADPGTSYEETV